MISDKMQKLVDEFDEAARNWGWAADQAHEWQASKCHDEYANTKLALEEAIKELETRLTAT